MTTSPKRPVTATLSLPPVSSACALRLPPNAGGSSGSEPEPPASPSLDFSKSSNSQYLGTV